MTKPTPEEKCEHDRGDYWDTGYKWNMRLKSEMYQDRMLRWLYKFNLPEYVSSSTNIVNPMRSNLICGKWWLDKPY
jgi:hypothetical protein